MPFLGVPLIVVFIESVLAVTAGRVSNPQSFISPVKFFGIFPFLAVVAFYLGHSNLTL
jgi:hypothetical protein